MYSIDNYKTMLTNATKNFSKQSTEYSISIQEFANLYDK